MIMMMKNNSIACLKYLNKAELIRQASWHYKDIWKCTYLFGDLFSDEKCVFINIK